MSERGVILLRYAEVFLKGGNRPLYERRLVQDCVRVAKPLGARVDKLHGRILVRHDVAVRGALLDRLARVFGLSSLSPAALVRPLEQAGIEAACLEAARAEAERRGGKPSFKVEARRSNKRYPLGSPEIAARAGGEIFERLGLPVDLHRPDFVVGVEVGDEQAYVYCEHRAGAGGMPRGSAGRVVSMLSGGIDSPVATWLAMKRGCEVAPVYFHSFPFTGDRTKQKVADLCGVLARWHGAMTLRVVHFTEVQKKLRESGPAELAVLLYRRMMLRATELIARRIGALGIVTGENLGQVASQTLSNLGTVGLAATLPVLRPLICNDKLETIGLARRIGTYELSILPYEDCCTLFSPPHPATRSQPELLAAIEGPLGVDDLATQLADSVEEIAIEDPAKTA